MDNDIRNLIYSALFSFPRADGTFEGNLSDIMSAVSRRKPIVLFVFPPKCGGTFLRSAAIAAVRGQLVRSVHAQGGREAQFYLPTFVLYYLTDVFEHQMVAHVHMQARAGNCHFIEALHLKPVVMVRSISDMLVSMMDMFENEEGAIDENITCAMPQGYLAMSPEKRADFLIDMFAPWYVSFYASWFSYDVRSSQSVMMLRFRDLQDHAVELLGAVLQHCGCPCTAEICQTALDDIWTQRNTLRYNKGVSGRGRQFFTPEHLERLSRMIGYYSVLSSHRDELL